MHSVSEMEQHYIPNVSSSTLASHFFISPDLDLLDMFSLQETIPGFQVFHGPAPASCEMLDKPHGLIMFESDEGG